MLVASLIEQSPTTSGIETGTHHPKEDQIQTLALLLVPAPPQHKGFLLVEIPLADQTLRLFELCDVVWEEDGDDNQVGELQNLGPAQPLDEHG